MPLIVAIIGNKYINDEINMSKGLLTCELIYVNGICKFYLHIFTTGTSIQQFELRKCNKYGFKKTASKVLFTVFILSDVIFSCLWFSQ